MSLKPKILIFIDWFTPGYKAGGPIKSVTNIISSLHNNFDFHVITSDRDINDKLPYPSIKFDSWIENENYNIIYLSQDTNRKQWIKNHLTENSYDYYYFNSLFSKDFTLNPLKILKHNSQAHKIILAPRGMLGKGALSIKPIKKKLFLSLSKILGYFNAIKWHATNIEEQNDIISVFGNSAYIKIASNISLCKINKQEIEKTPNQLKLVFFSRISLKKNLLYALELIKDYPEISLSVYGNNEDLQYYNQCAEYVKNHSLNVNFNGEIHPSEVNKILSAYHFLLLPTLHENFGHVIVEALTAGLGLIISDNTPWRNLKEKNIGWDINLENKSKFKEVINHCLDMDQNDYNTIRNNCYNFVEDQINSVQEVEDTKNLFS